MAPRLAAAAVLLSALAQPAAGLGLGVPQNLCFAAVSDWGGTNVEPFTTPGQLSAAASLAKVAATAHPRLVVSAGGNFLPQGLPAGMQTPQAQTRFAATFENVYNTEPLMVPWYITSGFHDWEGNVTAEMAFNGSTASSDRWIYPDLWHTFTITLPPYEETVQFVMVDTETLTGEQNQFPGWGNLPNLYYPPPAPSMNMGRRRLASWGGSGAGGGGGSGAAGGAASAGAAAGARRRSHARQLRDFDIKNAPPISTVQWEWVQHTLSNSTATWIIVIGNDPVWSAGEHGPTWSLVDKLLPMMEEAGVALYIGGRDPIAQHITPMPITSSVDFIGIGNGQAGNTSQAAEMPNEGLCPDGSVAWSYGASSGFAMVQVVNPTSSSPSALTVTFYDDTGTALYSFTKGNPRAYKGYTVTATNMRRTLTIMAALFLAVAACLCGVAGSSYLRAQATKKSFAGRGPRGAPGAQRRGVSETTPLVLRASNVGAASLSNL